MTNIDVNDISGMSYYQLQGALKSGEFSIEEMRQAYSTLRERARGRSRTVTSAKNRGLYDVETPPKFATAKQLKNPSDLLRELHDVNRYLGSYRSTVKGLEKHKQDTIAGAQKWGIDVNNDNYKEYLNFMNWFRSSEYSVKYDSGSTAVKNAFNNQRAGKNEIARAWAKYKAGMSEGRSQTGAARVRK